MKNLVLRIILVLFSGQLFSQVYPPDSIAVRQIYDVWYTNATPSYCTQIWQSNPFDMWCYVFTDSSGRVVQLGESVDFAPNSYIHPAIGQLTELRDLRIEHQANLTGVLPIELGDLTKLEQLIIHETNISGAIPSSLNNIASLKALEIVGIDSVNALKFGGILPEINNLNFLETFILDFTNIRGNISGYYGYLNSLEYIHIIKNPFFGGLLSDSLCHSQTIGHIRIGNCPAFYGKLPDSLGRIPTLSDLYLYRTNFSDTVPYSVCNPDTNLMAYLPNNEFTGISVIQPGSKVCFYDLSRNKIQFGCFEDNLLSLGSYNDFNVHIGVIHPQDSMLSPLDTTIAPGWNITLDSRVTGQYNMYYWYKDSVYLGWNTTGLWEITGATQADAGQYNCRIRNYYITPLKGLILDRFHITLNIDSTVTITENDVKDPQVFPVPFSTELNINLNRLAGKYTKISLYNSAGVPVKEVETRKYYQIYDTSELPAGLYFLRLQQGEKSYEFKLLKE